MEKLIHRVKIELRGCDESTEFNMDLGYDDITLLLRIAAKAQEVSGRKCQPTLKIKEEEQ